MDSKHITVVYKWTAQPGKLEELASIYSDVTDAMEANEPGAEAVHIYVSEQDNAVYVRDEFETTMAMMADGRVRAAPLHTSTVGLAGLAESFADLSAGGSGQVKVLVDPNA